MPIMLRSTLCVLVGVLSVAIATAQPAPQPFALTCSVQSAPYAVALVELYTSEGCSSCPPADRWLSALPSLIHGQGSVVPLAMHVDYWNSLGWTDRFSDHRYTVRQSWLAQFAGSHQVYTPEVFVNGREVRDWQGGALPQLAQALGEQAARAHVQIKQQAAGQGHFHIDASVDQISGRHEAVALQLVLYQNGLSSVVDAGENRGATLHHGFVARLYSEPVLAQDGRAHATLSGAWPAEGHGTDLGFVAFAEDVNSGEVLQAVALPACGALTP